MHVFMFLSVSEIAHKPLDRFKSKSGMEGCRCIPASNARLFKISINLTELKRDGSVVQYFLTICCLEFSC